MVGFIPIEKMFVVGFIPMEGKRPANYRSNGRPNRWVYAEGKASRAHAGSLNHQGFQECFISILKACQTRSFVSQRQVDVLCKYHKKLTLLICALLDGEDRRKDLSEDYGNLRQVERQLKRPDHTAILDDIDESAQAKERRTYRRDGLEEFRRRHKVRTEGDG